MNQRAIRPLAKIYEELDIPYALSGSLASSLYGFQRATLQIDFVAGLRQKHLPSFCAQLSGLYLLHKEEIEAAIRQKSCFTLVHLESLLKVIVTLTGMLTMGQQVFHQVRKIALVEGEHSVSVLSPEQMILLLLEALIDGLRLWESAIYLNEPSGNRVSDIPKARAKLDTQTVSRSHCHH